MNKITKRVLQVGIPAVVVGALLVPRLGLLGGSSPLAGAGARVSGALPVSGIVARMSKAVDRYPVNGELYPNQVVELVSETVGKVVKVNFNDGDRVQKGALLLKVDDSDLQAQMSRSTYQKKLLEAKLERQRMLLDRESVSLESYEELETEYNILLADIELLQVKINRTEIRAPFDGQIGFRHVSDGSYVQQSTPIATLTDNSVLRIEFYLPEQYWNTLSVGKRVSFRARGVEEEIVAEIYSIDPQADAATRKVLVRGRYENQANLLAGLFLNGEISFSDEEFIMVPTEAVVPEMEGKRLWIARGGKATSVAIEIDSRDNRNVEVTSGVQVGDTVLITGLMQLREGAAVDVRLQ
ncbi:MAG: efflux RND transporter periplasmic adaptor subunit [Odoribacteraceae bacterium]|jgi:membrane fusion protein (multidrug efflux system)|nr:efflux RND transporter periplasmic adaptor subunit [Odoribacteraceae bacterium]